jgi:biopolymer transport protein ExbB
VFPVIGLFAKGGVLMWPLFILSVLAVGVIIERLIYYIWMSRKDSGLIERLSLFLEQGDIGECEKECETGSGPFIELIRHWLALAKKGPKKLEEAVEHQGSSLLEEMEKRLPVLSVIGQIAPLLGLLGTVIGMIRAFLTVERMAGRVDAPALAGGIWEALITTAFGLSIAIPSLLFYYYFESRVDYYERRLHRFGHQLIDLAEDMKNEASPSEEN